MTHLPDALWRSVNEVLDAGRSPWVSAAVIDWLAEHPEDFAALERTLERVHLGSRLASADARPRARLAVAAGIALAALAPLAARFTPPRAEALAPRAAPLTVYALEIQLDRGTPKPASLAPAAPPLGPFAYVDVRVETLTRRNPRR